jgi:uncharacterized membrane protein YdbT with pleckstrin-like domain
MENTEIYNAIQNLAELQTSNYMAIIIVLIILLAITLIMTLIIGIGQMVQFGRISDKLNEIAKAAESGKSGKDTDSADND